MPRVVDSDEGPLPLGHIFHSLLVQQNEVVDLDEVPIAKGLGEVPQLADLASILDLHAPAPALVSTDTQEGNAHVTN